MDISTSKYSGATSESGWTQYLEQSSISESYFQRKDCHVEYEGKRTRMNKEEKFEEDLSMVSDASSGPPHFDNEYSCDLSSTTKESMKKKHVKKYDRISQQSSPLDDTASSPFFTCPKKCHKVNVVD
ncbi:hypothetical protein TSUD_05750 [Trifolium subterraneum]|uniref:Uncharacterized protein n=1 Tax=Trifolium subterraneum TaxID=3900 RepID=A0A2Z6N6Y6_TRISU|nr:hypothetical protein TSUD_05750 [Trifolium subterraneum]